MSVNDSCNTSKYSLKVLSPKITSVLETKLTRHNLRFLQTSEVNGRLI